MKSYLNSWKSFIKTLTTDLHESVIKLNIPTRFVAVVMITALIMPMFFFGTWQTTSAQIQTSSLKMNVLAPVSAPPQAFNLSSSHTVSSKTLAAASSFNASMLSAYGTIVGAVTAPTLPEGFAMAQPVSPLYASISSSTSSLSSTLGTLLGISTTTPETTANVLTTQTASGNTEYDFDGDGKSDIARWSPSSGEWKIKNSNGGSFSIQTLGSSVSVLAPGDFDGDSKTDIAVFTSGIWTIKPSGGGSQYTVSFGTSGDIPVTGDYNGDGRSDYAIFRPSTSTFWVMHSNDYSYYNTAFGVSGDIPVPGDYDGDGKTDIAIYHPSAGDWYIKQSSNNVTINPHWGVATDIPVPADYDGDGITDLSVYRPSSGTWFIYKSAGGGSYIQQIWGNYGDQPVPADYDGDGKADLAIWRPMTGVWYMFKSCNYDNSCGSNPQYIYETLGMNGDVPIEAAYLKKIGGLVQDYNLAKLRLSPKNATGGTDLYSRNFSWGTGLVGLPGRAGLDAGFGISYNSLVWLKDTTNNVMIFDPDQSNVSPGFRMGFPTIEPVYYDNTTGKFSYLMVTPSGGRVEFQQTAASGIYETIDSSYVQLRTKGATNPNDPVESIGITITGTDGTQMSYGWLAGAFRCNQIKDRNGNYITIVHDEYGLLRTVTDTLGRVITVNYDTEFYPTSITQQWQTNNGAGSATTHTWATFGYTTLSMNPSFDLSLGVFGPTNNTVIKVLDKVVYGNPSSSSLNTGETRFEYNAFGQVKKIRNMAADGHELNYVETNLDSPGTNEMDVPRFTQTRTKVENFNNGSPVVVDNSVTENQPIPEAGGTGTKIEVSMVGHPHSAVSKTFVGSSGWIEGLPIVSEDWADNGSGVARQRWTQSIWTQDNTNLSYIQNPRIIESKVGDINHVKRVTTTYKTLSGTTIAEYGLVNKVEVYGTNQSTVLKKIEIDYVPDSAYISRRIIGLPAEIRSYGVESSSLVLGSKTTYGYDEENFSQETNQNISSVIQHDNTSYSANFLVGRGNPTSTTRHDVMGQTPSISSKLRYDIAGSIVARLDPLNRKVRIEYTDVYNDNQNRNSFAYPTKIYDPANNYSDIKYRFDTGTNVWAKSPAPIGNISGKETTRLYDDLGRLSKETLVNTGAYMRYVYPANQIQSKVYTTITDVNNDGVDISDEVYSENWTDGANRVRYSRSELPGSVGGWSASKIEYDILGRVIRSTVPTEINPVNTSLPTTWIPTGDDIRGTDSNGNPLWLWIQQEYDWKSRVTKEINPQGGAKLFEYTGCGCSGNEIITTKSEEVETGKRRVERTYTDPLGRSFQTEVLDWNGYIYTTVVNEYDARDNILSTKQYEGAAYSGNFQQITNTYDGHGRIKTKHIPQQDSDKSTVYNYYADDSIQSVVDARGVSTSFTYNNRGLVEQTAYSLPNPIPPGIPTIVENSPVSFQYDNVGNRINMTDGLGTVDYEYNSSSQITKETRHFSGPNVTAMPNAPLSNNGFALAYEYHLSGELSNITDPYGTTITYKNDKIGRLKQVTGINTHVNQYVGNVEYRAWGAVKKIEYGNQGLNMNLTYNNRLLPQTQDIQSPGNTTQGVYAMQKEFNYYGDGSFRYIKDGNGTDYDRFYKYDFVGRLIETVTGPYARGQSPQYDQRTLYKQTYQYDVWGNAVNYKRGSYFMPNAEQNIPLGTSNYDNNRQTSFSSTTTYGSYSRVNQFDADGRLSKTTHYDYGYSPPPGNYTASETHYGTDESPAYTSVKDSYKEYYFTDGDRHPSASKSSYYDSETETYSDFYSHYKIRSTVLGGDVVSEAFQNGSMHSTYVYAFGQVILRLQTASQPTPDYQLSAAWEHRDVAATQLVTSFGGGTGPASYYNFTQLDPSNSAYLNIPNWEHQVSNGDGTGTGSESGGGYPGFGDGYGGDRQGGNCYVDGIATNCATALNFLETGVGVQCPDHGCGPVGYNGQLYLFDPRAAAMGIGTVAAGLGYLPSNVTFTGNSFLVNGTANFNISPFGRSLPGTGTVTIGQLNGVSDGWWSSGISAFQMANESAQTSGTPQNNVFVSEKDALATIEEVYNDAIAALANKDCLKALSSGSYDALDTLKTIGAKNIQGKRQGIYNYENSTNGRTIAETFPSKAVVSRGWISLYNMFFTGYIADVGSTNTTTTLNLTAREARLLTFLHEVGHLTSAYSHSAAKKFLLIYENVASDAELNRIVYNNCIKASNAPSIQ